MSKIFVKIDDNMIVNMNSIVSIDRINIPTNEFSEWNAMYHSLMTEVSTEYMKTHPEEVDSDEVEMANKLYDKFSEIVKRNIEYEMGPCPEPFRYEYRIILNTGLELTITEEVYNKLCEYAV